MGVPGLNQVHASTSPQCYGCHVLLDPTRSIMSSTYSWFFDTQTDATLSAVPGVFAFGGVVKAMSTIDDFASALEMHPRMSAAWVQKLCYYVNSAPCAASDLTALATVRELGLQLESAGQGDRHLTGDHQRGRDRDRRRQRG